MKSENRVKKVVLTGGPCSGKTTLTSVLKDEFGDRIEFVPEVATMLLGNGFPLPGKDVDWSEDWQSAFQGSILPVQKNIETAFEIKCREKNVALMVCDRGLLDGAAYTPGGNEEFCNKFNIDEKNALESYDAVIHLESLATLDPVKYGKANNENRFEPLERAQELEQKTRETWSSHKRHIVIDGRRGIEGKISEVIGIIKFLLAEKI